MRCWIFNRRGAGAGARESGHISFSLRRRGRLSPVIDIRAAVVGFWFSIVVIPDANDGKSFSNLGIRVSTVVISFSIVVMSVANVDIWFANVGNSNVNDHKTVPST